MPKPTRILALPLLLALAAPASHAQAPSNDDYGGAIAIGGLPYDTTVPDASQATGDASDPLVEGAFPTLWYRFTPSADVDVLIDTSASDGVQAVVVFLDPPGTTTMAAVPVVEETPWETGAALFANHTYTLMVVGFDPTGQLVLSMTERDSALPPVNDRFESAVTIPSLPFTDTRDISDATGQASDPFVGGNDPTVWYRFTPETDMVVVFDTSDSSDQVSFPILSDPGDASTYVGGTEDDPSVAEVSLSAGVTYYLMMVAYGTPGTLSLEATQVLPPAPPANDEVAGAFEIALPYEVHQDISLATGSPSDPFTAGGTPTVWYRFTATEDLPVRFDASESGSAMAFAVFTDPPSEATFVAGTQASPSLNLDVRAGTTYFLMVIPQDVPAGELVLEATDLSVRGPPVEIYVVPGDAPNLATIIADAEPTRPLDIVMWPGDYALDQPLVLERGYVTFRSADATSRPRLVGTSEEAVLFVIEGQRELAFIGLEMDEADVAISGGDIDGLTIEDCVLTARRTTVMVTGGKRAVLRDNTLVAGGDVVAGLAVVSGIKVIGNVVLWVAGTSETEGVLGLLLVNLPPEAKIDPSLARRGDTLIVRDNLVTVPGLRNAGIIVGVSFGPTFVEGNIVASGTGMVVPVVDIARSHGDEPSPQVIAGNVITASGVGIVGTGAYGHIDILDNTVTMVPLTALDPDLAGMQVAGIVAAKFSGSADVSGNDVILPTIESAVDLIGIYQLGASGLGEMTGFFGLDDTGLAHIASNRVLGGHYGITATNLFESSVEIAGNQIGLGPFGQAGIAALRLGGSQLTAETFGQAPMDYVEHPFSILDNEIYSLDLTSLIAPPTGIAAFGMMKGDGALPLVVQGNLLRGVFSDAIGAQGNPVLVRRNKISGAFTNGIDTANLPEVSLYGGVGNFAPALGDLFPDGLEAFDLPPSSSSVTDNVMTLVVPKRSVTPVINEPGAYLRGNQFGYLVPRPWGP